MAETSIWNISSTDDPELHYVTRNDPDDGNYIFTPPESGQITYKITYTNGSATGETIYVVKSTDCYVDPCQNSLEGPVVTFTDPEGATAKTVESTAGNAEVTYDLGTCWTIVKAEIDGIPNNITSFRYGDGKIIYYSANSTIDETPSTAKYIFKNTEANITSYSYVKIIQKSKCASDTNCPQIISPTTTVSVGNNGTGNNPIQVSYNLTNCWYLKSKSLNVGTDVASFTSDDGKNIKVEKNTGAEPRSIQATYIFENPTIPKVCDEPPQYVNIEQEPGCTCTCGAISRIDADKPEFHPLTGGTNLVLKRLQLTSQFNENNCPLDIFEPYVWPGYENKGIVPGSLYVKRNEQDSSILEIRGTLTGTSVKRAIAFGIKICGQDCNNVNPPFYVFQRCYCGTDDCRNEYDVSGQEEPIIEDHPMYIGGCGNYDDTTLDRTSNRHPEGKFNADGDSVYVNSLYLRPIDENGNLSTQRIELFHIEGNTCVVNPVLKDFLDTNGDEYVPTVTYNSQGHALQITVDPNNYPTKRPILGLRSLIGAKKNANGTWSNNTTLHLPTTEESWSINLETDSDEIDAGIYEGKSCCKSFISTVWQAPQRKKYNKDYRIDDMATLEQCP